MTRGRGAASIVASPVLVGAVTTLVVIVSVFLAYNANQGLPFVPTYDLSAELPRGANLVAGNDVRIGGFRAGVIDELRPDVAVVDGERRSITVVDIKFDKVAEPLPVDTRFTVRPRSALGLKYIEVEPGKSDQEYKAGATVPVKYSTTPPEFDDLLTTFDTETRQNSQIALEGYGDAFAGRGQSINEAIGSLSELFLYLRPVMSNLADPETQLDEFFRQIGRTSAQVAPVARVQAELFSNMADTFEAIGRNPDALRATIEKSPPTLDAAIRSFRIQRPFLGDFADLSRRLRPAARILPVALPRLNRAFRVGTPVLRESVALNVRTGRVFDALDDLASEPSTKLALEDLTTLTTLGAPLLGYVAPFQSVCSYATTFFTGLGGHISEGVTNGTAERVLLKTTAGQQQDNRPGDFGDRPADVPANIDPTGAKDPTTDQPLATFQGTPYTPAIDAQGNADCQAGQYGYPDRLVPSFARYKPEPLLPGESLNTWSSRAAGGSHIQTVNDAPWVTGPTFNGVRSLRDVP